MKKTSYLLSILLLASVPGLAACTYVTDVAYFEDKTWGLVEYGEPGSMTAVLENAAVTVRFNSDDNRVAGTAGCNHYFAGYRHSGGLVSLEEQMAVTEMWCGEEIGEQEKRYLEILQAVQSYEIDGLTLRLSGKEGGLVYTLE